MSLNCSENQMFMCSKARGLHGWFDQANRVTHWPRCAVAHRGCESMMYSPSVSEAITIPSRRLLCGISFVLKALRSLIHTAHWGPRSGSIISPPLALAQILRLFTRTCCTVFILQTIALKNIDNKIAFFDLQNRGFSVSFSIFKVRLIISTVQNFEWFPLDI